MCCLYVADPATFLALNGVSGSLFSPVNGCFIQLLQKINISEFVSLPRQYHT